MRPSLHYLAAFPRAQPRRGGRVPATRAQSGEQERYLCNSWPISRRHRGTWSAGGGVLEQFMRLKQNLNCGCDVSGNVRLNHGKKPALVLHPGGDAEVGPHPIVAAHPNIVHLAASANEFLADFLVPEIQLQAVA